MFNPLYNFSDSIRHTKFVGLFYARYLSEYEDDNLFKTHHPFKDNTALVYSGGRRIPSASCLLDANGFDVFPNKRFYTVEPDFMLFRNNKFLINKAETRVLGQPDLIAEVWSDSNDENERNFKQDLYSTSPITEHWYIEQESNEVVCYLGETRLPSQYLNEPLITRSNIVFDLRRLALL